MIQYLVFDVEKQRCAVSIHDVKEVVRNAELELIPDQPKFILGFLNLRGTLVPVIDLRTRFFLPEIQNEINHRLVVVDIDGLLVALKVDLVLKVQPLETNDSVKKYLKKIEIKSHFVSAISNYQDVLTIVLDIKELFNDVEAELLQSFKQTERSS
jgi:chemotaxis signal transduction protein